MEIIFLYNGLLGISKQQLKALKKGDFELMEKLTTDRELLTNRICAIIDEGSLNLEDDKFNSKAREITEEILDIDEDIKDALLEELFYRKEKLSRIRLVEE